MFCVWKKCNFYLEIGIRKMFSVILFLSIVRDDFGGVFSSRCNEFENDTTDNVKSSKIYLSSR